MSPGRIFSLYEIIIIDSTHVLSSITDMERSSRTISPLDPYTPRGFIKNRSKALKSTLVIDAYAPGDTELMKRCMESWAMITLSTIDRLDQSPCIRI
jgi:hypothetical protein